MVHVCLGSVVSIVIIHITHASRQNAAPILGDTAFHANNTSTGKFEAGGLHRVKVKPWL